MIHKSRKTMRFLAAFLAGVITFTSGSFEVLAAEADSRTRLEAALAEESDKAPETSANSKEDSENTADTDETVNETPEETRDTDNVGDSEEKPADSEEEPNNPEEPPADSEEKPDKPEEAPADSEEAPVDSEEAPVDSEEIPTDSEEPPADSKEDVDSPQVELTTAVNSEGGSYKNITWNIDNEGKLTVTGSGDFSDNQYSVGRAPWYECRDSIKSAVVNVTGMTNALAMFFDCSNLESVDLSGFDTAHVTNMGYMFSGCKSLENLDLSGLDMSNVTDMSYMFSICKGLNNLILSASDFGKVRNTQDMFAGCLYLQSLNLSGMNAANVSNAENMFELCNRLSIIYAPYNVTQTISLPIVTGNVWYGPGRTEITELPKNLNHSIAIAKNRIPAPLGAEQRIRLYVPYNQRKEGQTINIFERFAGYAGIVGCEITSYTEDAKINGNVLSTAPTLKNGILHYGTNTGTIGDFATIIMKIACTNQSDITLTITICFRDFKNDIAHGSYKGITWIIDKDGKLTVEGQGNFRPRKGESDWNWEWESEPESVPWFAYRDSIQSAEINVTAITDLSLMFFWCSNLSRLDLSGLDTSNVTDMHSMFGMFMRSELTELDVSNFDTANVIYMYNMFGGCSGLTELDVSNFDTSNVIDMAGMFDLCSGLSSLDVSNFDTSNVIDMGELFSDCSGLSSLDVSNFDTSKVVRFSSMFAYCSGLSSIDVSNFNTANAIYIDWMFCNCTGLSSLDVSNFDTSNVINMNALFSGCSGLSSLDVSNFDTSNVIDMGSLFNGCTGLSSLDVSNFDTTNVTNMGGLFAVCSGLSSLDIINFDTTNVTLMNGMFSGCTGLTDLDIRHFDTSKVTDMCGMFQLCTGLTNLDIRNFDTSKVTDMSGMFRECTGLTDLDVRHFDTSNVTNMGGFFSIGMFEGCTGLTSLDISNFDTSNVTGMGRMFADCTGLKSLDLSGFDTSKVEDMYAMFFNCTGLSSLDLSNFDTSNVTIMRDMFGECTGLTSLDISNFDTSKVTNMWSMFENCSSLKSLDVSHFDTSNVTNIRRIFVGCEALTSLDLSNFDLKNATTGFSTFSMLGGNGNLLEIHTPINLTQEVSLPGYYVWYMPDGSRIGRLPQNLSYSVLIKRDKASTSPSEPSPSESSLTATKTKTVYVCGESLNIDDITVTYNDGTGFSTIVTDFTTNADEIDMSVPGKKILKVTYKGMTAEIELKVTCSLTDSQVTVTFPEQTFVYCRLPITPEPTVTVSINGTDILLYEGRDYRLSYQNNVNAGNDARIIMTGRDIYSGTITRTFTIEKAPLMIAASDITLIAGDELPDASVYEYQVQGICRGDRLIKKPSFTCDVTDMSKTGTYTITPHNADAGSNYEITYDSGTLTVVENGVYHTVVFDLSGHGSNMTRRAIKTGTLLKEPAQPHGPESTGYIFSGWYKDRSFAAKQKWNFAVDTVQDDMTLYACWLSMAAENGKGADLCIQDILPQTYTGSPIKPTVLVYDSDGMTLLKAGKDYTVSYCNNTEADAVKFAGSQIPTGGTGTLLSDGSVDTSAGFHETLAYVVIKGKGNYKGTIYRNFHIDKALISADGNTASGSAASGITLKYTDSLVCNDKKEQKPFTSIKYKKAMTAGKDYTVTLSANAGEVYTAKAADGTGIPLKTSWRQSNDGKTLPTIPKGYFGKFKMTIEGIGNYDGTVEKTIYVSADKSHLMKNVSVTLGKNQKKKANVTKEELAQGITLTPAYYDASNNQYYLFDENGEPTGTPMDKGDDVFAVKAGKTGLKYGKDYVISSYVNNHAIGTATMIIQGIGEYTGTKNITFTITGTPFKNITVEGLKDMAFTGKAITQSDLTLTNGRDKTDSGYKKFEYGADYSIAYKNNIKKGTAAITFTAKPESGYSGSFKKTFKITAADLNRAAAAAAIKAGDRLRYEQDAYTFSGTVYYTKNGATLSDRIRLISSEYADITLKEGVDYTVNYTNNKAVTTGSDAIMRLKGKGNYQGTLTIKFPIVSAPISAGNKNLTITAGAVYYDGKKNRYVPKIKVTDGKKALSIGENKDYIVKEYSNNEKAAIEEYLQLLRSGSAIPRSKKPQAVLSGKGNYSGDTTLYFDVYDVKININNIYIVITDDSGRLTYSGRQLKPEIAVYYGKDSKKVKAAKLAGEQDESVLTSSVNGGYGLTRLTNRMDYTLTWGSNATAGKNKGSVTITGMGLYGGKVTGKFTILSKDIYK